MNTSRMINVDQVADSIQRFSNLSMELLADSFKKNMKMINDMEDFYNRFRFDTAKSKSSKCCPPEPTCPPRCILEISREAFVGEKLIQPFQVKNQCGSAKTYRLGVRPFKNQHGDVSPISGVLDKNMIQLEAGQSITVLLSVDLSQEVRAGDCFSTDIVIREDKVNQNICFQLRVKAWCDVPTATPLKEQYYFNHWQSWQSHFYCEQKPEYRTNHDHQITI